MFNVICIKGVDGNSVAPGVILLQSDVVYVGSEYTVEEQYQFPDEDIGYVLAERSPFNLYNSNLFARLDSGIEEKQLEYASSENIVSSQTLH